MELYNLSIFSSYFVPLLNALPIYNINFKFLVFIKYILKLNYCTYQEHIYVNKIFIMFLQKFVETNKVRCVYPKDRNLKKKMKF